MTQTNYNERLKELIRYELGDDLNATDVDEAVQSLTQLFKDLVTEAKPGRADTQIWRENPDDAWDMAIDQFEQNILKLLEEK